MKITYDTISDYRSFLALRDPWNALVEASDSAHAFLRHEWYECWLRHLNQAGTFNFALAKNGSDLLAVSPMQVVPMRVKGLAARVLKFAGSTITPRNAFLVREPASIHDFFDRMRASARADLTIADQVESAAPSTQKYLSWLHDRNLSPVVTEARQSPFLETGAGWQSYWDGLSGSFRTLLMRGEKKLLTAGDLEMRQVRNGTEFRGLLPELTAVSSRSWKAKDKTDLAALPTVVEFLNDFCVAGDPASLWECWILRLNGKVIAFQFYLRHTQRISLIRTDFDLEYGQLSPGRVLQLAVVRDLFQRPGTWEYDFGGQAYDYKLKWTSRLRRHIDIWSAGKGLYGKILMVGKRRLLPFVEKRQSSRQGSQSGERE